MGPPGKIQPFEVRYLKQPVSNLDLPPARRGRQGELALVKGGADIGAEHMVQVTINADHTTTIVDMENHATVTIVGTISLGSAVFWAG